MMLGQRIERKLYETGFVNPGVRSIIRSQIYLAVGSSVLLLAVTALSAWAWAFAAGALLVTVNFWYMAKAVQKLIYVRKGAVTALLLLFYGRLIVTVLAIMGLIIFLDVPVVGLLTGLSTVVVTAITWTLLGVIQKTKEA
ncbi:MAG: ATP synthase subunit I [Desulfovibrionaceae bacterium]|jgi:hypothetical protein